MCNKTINTQRDFIANSRTATCTKQKKKLVYTHVCRFKKSSKLQSYFYLKQNK